MVEATHVQLEPSSEAPLVTDAKNPEGKYAGRSFTCTSCRGMLWGTHQMFGDGLVFVRAGTLVDANRYVQPSAHFFVRSKHPWIIIPDGLKAYETLPNEEDKLWDAELQKRVEAAMTDGK
jgi:hypothetical protein